MVNYLAFDFRLWNANGRQLIDCNSDKVTNNLDKRHPVGEKWSEEYKAKLQFIFNYTHNKHTDSIRHILSKFEVCYKFD